MIEKIEALRKKPKHIRNRYAFWAAFSVTFIIAVLWLTTLPSRFTETERQEPEIAEEESESFAGIVDTVSSKFKETFSGVWAASDMSTSSSRTQEPVYELDLQAIVASSTEQETQDNTGTTSASSTATSSPAELHASTTPETY